LNNHQAGRKGDRTLGQCNSAMHEARCSLRQQVTSAGDMLALKRRTSLRRADFPDRERNPWMIDVPPCRGGKGGCRAVPWEARAERRLSQGRFCNYDVCTVLYGISEKQISIANVNYPGQSAHHVIGPLLGQHCRNGHFLTCRRCFSSRSSFLLSCIPSRICTKIFIKCV
jgi:hypothetical protein